jgi:hypothetical protein
LIAKVVALNLFAIFFVSVMYVGSRLLFLLASHIVIALPTIAIEKVVAPYAFKGDSKK